VFLCVVCVLCLWCVFDVCFSVCVCFVCVCVHIGKIADKMLSSVHPVFHEQYCFALVASGRIDFTHNLCSICINLYFSLILSVFFTVIIFYNSFNN